MLKKILGTVAILLAIILYFFPINYKQGLTETTGSVVSYKKVQRVNVSLGGGPTLVYDYFTVVSFQTQDGKNIQFTETVPPLIWDYKAGQKVKVFYSPSNPQDASIPSPLPDWIATAVLFFGGISLLFSNFYQKFIQ